VDLRLGRHLCGISLAAIAPLPPDPPQVSLPPPAPLHPLGFLVSLVGHHLHDQQPELLYTPS
jgi:hypothetical protein